MNLIDEPSQRQIRFGEVIRGIISDTINQNHILNEEIELGPITVSFVKVSKDLKIASVYIMPLGGYEKEKIFLEIELYPTDYVRLKNDSSGVRTHALSDQRLKLAP